MKQIVDRALIIKRQDFGEADRIVTFLTLENGKLTGIVKGARRPKSKMAGGIELFSVSTITFLAGKSDLKTIVSTRLDKHFDKIVRDVKRTMWAYEAFKFLDKSTEENTGPSYYHLAENLLKALDDNLLSLEIVRLWFNSTLLNELGHGINTETNGEGKQLKEYDNFGFSFETMSFESQPSGQFTPAHIKLLRLTSSHKPEILSRVENAPKLTEALIPITEQAIRLWAH